MLDKQGYTRYLARKKSSEKLTNERIGLLVSQQPFMPCNSSLICTGSGNINLVKQSALQS